MNLYKLKKDGKTVGYLKIEDGRVLLNPITRKGYWCGYDWAVNMDLFDEAHSFVCHDKHGEKVFAGDETNHGAVAWNTSLLTWTLLENVPDVLGDNEIVGVTNLLSDYIDDFKLIKDTKP